jgi:hypothetical protein
MNFKSNITKGTHYWRVGDGDKESRDKTYKMTAGSQPLRASKLQVRVPFTIIILWTKSTGSQSSLTCLMLDERDATDFWRAAFAPGPFNFLFPFLICKRRQGLQVSIQTLQQPMQKKYNKHFERSDIHIFYEEWYTYCSTLHLPLLFLGMFDDVVCIHAPVSTHVKTSATRNQRN